MYLFATFEHTTYLELAISALERSGLKNGEILAVPLQKRLSDKKMLDTIHQSDGTSLFDGMTALGTVFMVFGTIYGFVLKWGPIIWALIGVITGAALGLLIDLLLSKRKGGKLYNGRNRTEVVLLIKCTTEHANEVEDILWQHLALGVGRLDR